MPSVYEENNFEGRVNYAAQCFVRGISNSRHFDTCFEMFDGQAVVTALVRRCEKNAKLQAAVAAQWGGSFPQKWLDTASEYQNISTRKLRDLAAQLRAEANERYKNQDAA